MCNVADVMHGTAVSTCIATNSMQVTADILPKTRLKVSCQTSEMAQPSRCLPSSLV